MSSGALETGIEHVKDDVTGRPAPEVLAAMADALREARSVLITAHVHPDGDALGSEVSLALALRVLGKEVRVVNNQEPPERYRALLPVGLLEVGDERRAPALAGAFDICAVLDTSEPDRTGALRPVIFRPGQRRICIDHHLLRGSYAYDHHLVVGSSPATGCLVLGLIDALGVPIDRPMAEALWIAIATDTGWFRFSNTNSMALACAARLVSHGVDVEALYAAIYGSHSAARTRLLGQLLAGLEYELEGRLAWTAATRPMLASSGISLDELDGVVDFLRDVRGVDVAALIVELPSGNYKVSLRARGDVGVEGVARGFGGGGHDKAAGFRFQGPLDTLVPRLCDAVRAAMVS